MKLLYSIYNNYNESLVSVFSRSVTLFSVFFITAIVSRELNDDDFALWTIFITFINLLPLLGFGLNTGLVNKLTFLNSKKKLKFKVKDLISSFLYFQLIISIILILAFLLFNTITANNYLIEISKKIIYIKILIITLLISIPFQIFTTLLYSYKKINIANISIAAHSFILLIIIYLTNSNNLNDYVKNYTYMYTSAFIIMYIITISYLRINLFKINILKYITDIKFIFTKSIQFWYLSVISNLLSTGQLLFVGFFFGVKNIAAYFLIQKIFSLLNTFHLAFISPYNIKFINNSAKGNWVQTRYLLNNLLFKITIPFFIIVGSLIFVFHSNLIYLWSEKVVTNYLACSLFLISGLMLGVTNLFSVYLNSMGLFNFQVKMAIIYFVLFFIFFMISKDYFNEYSIIFSTIPSLSISIYFYYRYTKKVINQNTVSI